MNAKKTNMRQRLSGPTWKRLASILLFSMMIIFPSHAQDQQQLQQDLLYFEEQLRWHPDDPDLNYNMAQVYFLLGKLDPAIKHLEKTLLVAPGDFEALLHLASIYRKIGKLAEARDLLLKGTALITDNPDLWYELGVVHSDLANYQPAVDAFTKALTFTRSDEQKQQILYYIAVSHLTARDFASFKKAMAQLDQQSDFYPALKKLGDLSN